LPTYLKHFPRPLLDELVAGRWMPIVGAGLSRNAELPSGRVMPLWDDLGRAMASDIPGHAYVGPVDAISAYRDEVSPLAEQAGWVPVSGFDVEVRAGNLLAAIRALLESSRLRSGGIP
jgi:hypothetical protein